MSNVLSPLTSFFKSLFIDSQRLGDHLWRNVTGAPTYRRSQITPQLYVGGQYNKRGIDKLKKMGITAIVSMRSGHARNLLDGWPVHTLHLATPDQQAPSIDNLQKGIAFIKHQIDNDGKVYVHCAHGEGRGPTMAAAYLISTGLTAADAIEQVRKIRTFIKITPVQFQQLEKVEKLYQKSET